MKYEAGLSQPVFLQCFINSRNISVKDFLKVDLMEKKEKNIDGSWSTPDLIQGRIFVSQQTSCILFARFLNNRHQIPMRKKNNIKLKSQTRRKSIVYPCLSSDYLLDYFCITKLPIYLLTLLFFFPLCFDSYSFSPFSVFTLLK